MRRHLFATIALTAVLFSSTAHGRVFSKPGWYVMIGAGTKSDPKKPIKGPYSTRADCVTELNQWLEMTDGTEVLACSYLDEGSEQDTLSPS